MKVSVHLRDGPNKTNMRSEAIARGIEAEGHAVVYSGRNAPVKNSDLVIQTGFAPSVALLDAIDRRVPYIIMEAPFWRDFYDVHEASSWGYNGLAGGAWRPEPPEEERPKPELKPMKEGDKTLIIGQKPTDHSLRGSDHVRWILDRKSEFPKACFRPHPLMVPHGTLRPIRQALKEFQRVITYTSTVGVEAAVDGCRVDYEPLSPASGCSERQRWHHELSWAQAKNDRIYKLSTFILSGYDEARERMGKGLFEVPRERVDGKAICERYYRLILP